LCPQIYNVHSPMFFVISIKMCIPAANISQMILCSDKASWKCHLGENIFLNIFHFWKSRFWTTKYHLLFIRGVHMYKVCYETCHLEQTLVMDRGWMAPSWWWWIFFSNLWLVDHYWFISPGGTRSIQPIRNASGKRLVHSDQLP